MKTKDFTVDSRELGMDEALRATEALGADCGLTRKEILRLRLIAEEMYGMLRSIAGEIADVFWIEHEGKSFALHLDTELALNKQTRKQLLSVSSTGKNEAAKGFMGKLRDMISANMLPKDSAPSVISLGLIGLGGLDDYGVENYDWSMQKYKEEIARIEQGETARKEWDELEKSIVANIADDVRIHIVGSSVKLTITKSF